MTCVHKIVIYSQVILLFYIIAILLDAPLNTLSTKSADAQQIVCNPFTPTDPNNPAGDGLPADWKINGIPYININNTQSHYKLPGSNPLHKDLYVEIDYMESRKPMTQAINEVIKAFSNAPVCNPDGKRGINLHIQVDEQIPFKRFTTVDDIPSIKNNYFGNMSERADPNLIAAKKLVYHYGLFVNDQDTDGHSGVSDHIPGMNFIVSLGSWPSGIIDPSTGRDIGGGTIDDQAGSFMHEFGHNLGLQHGGADSILFKPNYISVMNYAFQLKRFYFSDRPLDYSRCALPSINENKLNETKGIESGTCPKELQTTTFPHGDCSPSRLHPLWSGLITLGSSYDLDQDDSVPNANNLIHDVHCIATIDTLNGYDDWSHLLYRINENTLGSGITPTMFGNSTAFIMKQPIHKDVSLLDIKDAHIGLLNHIKTLINKIPRFMLVSPHVASNITSALRFVPIPQTHLISMDPKTIMNDLIGLGNGTLPVANSTSILNTNNSTTSGAGMSLNSNATIASNILNDNTDVAIRQLTELKALAGITPLAVNSTLNNSTSLGIGSTSSLGLINQPSPMQQQIQKEIDNLQGVLKP